MAQWVAEGGQAARPPRRFKTFSRLLKQALKPITQPIALTIAGSDSGGGAGLQADLKTFAALSVHGTCVTTCLTAQNPEEVAAILPTPPEFIQIQLETLFAELPPAAAKTGMLYSEAIIRHISAWWEEDPRVPLVVDPVMVATSGARLLKPAAMRSLMSRLFPQAILITPNLDEAELIVGKKIRSVEGLASAARTVHDRWGCAALIKGGHLKNQVEAIDVLFDGRKEYLLRAKFIRGVATHGTGCTYSAAITAYLARGLSLVQSVRQAKVFVTRAIRYSATVGDHMVLNPTRAAQL